MQKSLMEMVVNSGISSQHWTEWMDLYMEVIDIEKEKDYGRVQTR